MNISEPFIKRPVMTILVMVSILVFGLIAYKNLPVSDLPNVDYPTIEVTVDYPGSNPQTMSATCATPLEREFMTIDGVQSITSQSDTGNTTLILQFVLNKSMDTASLDVEAAINRAQPNLPNDLPYNPTYRKVNPSETPILYYAITSPSMPLNKLYDYGNTYIGQRLSMIEGVSQIQTYGAPYAARIQVNPEELAAMQMGLDEVSAKIQTGNVDIPVGTLFGPKNEYTIDVDGQLLHAEGYNELVIKSSDGSIVKINQVGRALDSLKNDKYYLNYISKDSSQPCIVLAVRKQPGANTVQVIQNIKNLLPTIEKQLPSSLQYHVIYDKSDSIIAGVDDVKTTLIIAFILVVTIIFLSLGKLSNTIMPTLSLPISIFATFAVMFLLNFSIDLLSLLALTLSIGFLVDDAIVVLENNVRHVQMGKKPFEATLEGSKEIAITVVSMTICLISVFIPMIFMGGVIGRLFREFAVTIAVAVLMSGFVSLSLIPLLSSRLIPESNQEKKKRFFEQLSEKINEKMLNFYKHYLEKLFNYKKTILTIGIFCVMGSLLLFLFLPKEFIPNDDVSFLQGYSESQDGTSPFEMAKYQEDISKTIINDDAVDYLVSLASVITDNQGLMFIKLKPYKERGPQDNVIKRLMTKLYPIAGVNSYISEIPLINLQVGTTAKALYQYALTSLDQDTLNHYSQKLLNLIKKMTGFSQVSSDLEIKQPQLELRIDRDKASNLNVSAFKIENLLKLAYSDNKISTINTDINQYDVIMETLPKYYKDPNVISQLYVRSETNKMIPLHEIVTATQTVGPLTVNHLNGRPSAMISFNLDGIALGTAVNKLENLATQILPTEVKGNVQGTADVFKQSFASITFLLIIAIFVIYVILGVLYESFIHPFTVMSTLPPATFGGLLMLMIFNETLSLYSFIGIIMLIGIVMKNGIMMVDFANDNVKKDQSIKDAIINACIVRFRPIMMTTFAAFMGASPIALGFGPSGEARRPLGLVVVGGLLISQILTLFLTPVTYYYMQTLQEKIKNIKLKKPKAVDENA